MANQPSSAKTAMELCDAALALPTTEQHLYLQEQCQNNKDLYAEAASLLAAVAASDQFLVSDDGSSQSGIAAVGDVIGGYKLLELIGQGGMGTVFRAERTDPLLRQQVALKIVNVQMLTPELRARFNAEREILASLQHPYIAGLVDGGTTDSGVPYLVMEFVPGLSINEYCDKHALPVNARLDLVEKVAAAVQFAHRNLIVHRDLKPSNILISDDGIPKLLDFGVAKLIQSPLQPKHGATTLFGHQAFTPDYASPEQIRGDGLTTASDVYSLGILTFELLVGKKPYTLERSTASELQAALSTLTVPKASSAWQAEGKQSTASTYLTPGTSLASLAKLRSSSPARLTRLLAGDLDTILAKATHSKIDRRYTSAATFAEDLHNFRKGRPVVAQGDSAIYRISRFLRTHRLGALAATAIVVSLAAGLTLSLWQANIAQQRFEDLHGLSQVLMSDIYESVANLPGSTAARELIATEAQHYLDSLAKSARGDPELSADLAIAYKRLGDVQGLPSNANLGQSEQALANYYNALSVADSLNPKAANVIAIKAVVREKIADVLAWRGDIAGSLAAGAESFEEYQALYEQLPTEKNLRQLALSQVKQGDTQGHPSFANAQDPAAATTLYRSALARLLTVDDLPNAGWRLRRAIALVHERLGTMALLRNDTDTALQHYQESKSEREQLAEQQPQHLTIVRDHGVALEKIADVQLQRGNSIDAVATFKQALAVYQTLARTDPEDVHLSRTLAYGYENLAEAEVVAGQDNIASKNYAKALALRELLVEIDPGAAHLATELQRTRTAIQRLPARSQ